MYLFIKRCIDLVIGIAAFIFFLPFFIPIILILRFTGEGVVFFLQERIGYKNRPFKLWKFATMLKSSPASGTVTAKNDSRILPFGRFLRWTKLNEMAQIFNVIKGDMSIVGPRPLTKECFDCYPDNLKPLIYRSKPGLTGIGSVVFRKEEDITAKSGKPLMQSYREDIMPVKGRMEAWYLENRSILVDIKIIILTALAIPFPGNRWYEKWFDNLPDLAFDFDCKGVNQNDMPAPTYVESRK